MGKGFWMDFIRPFKKRISFIKLKRYGSRLLLLYVSTDRALLGFFLVWPCLRPLSCPNTCYVFQHLYVYEIVAEYPAFQSGDECINENNAILIGITWDANRDAPHFRAERFHWEVGKRY